MKNTLVIVAAIIVAGGLIAGAVIWSSNSGSNNNGQSAVRAEDLNYDSAQITSLIDEVGVNNRSLGEADAPVRIVEYSDTECPYCKRFHGTMLQIMEQYGPTGQVAWEYRYFPIAQLHQQATEQAEALECINQLGGEESFWIGLDTIFTLTRGNDTFDHDQLPAVAETAGVDPDEFQECLASDEYAELVQSEIEEAQSRGASGTPFSVFELAEPISASARAAVEQIDDEQAPGQNLFTFSEDGTEVRVSGAIPFPLMEQILNSILDS